MKKYLVIAICILVTACSSNDSDNVSQSNAPSGALIKVEVFNLISDITSKLTYSFDSRGRIASLNQKIFLTDETRNTTVTYSYNSNGQIVRHASTYEGNDEITEYVFNIDLITSSTRYHNNGSIYRRNYSYNNIDQLIRESILNENNIETASKEYTYTNNGNIENTYQENDGSFIEYTFEYDNKNNPANTLYNNQEISKIIGYNYNNKTKRVYSTNNGTNVYTLEYTYNDAGYPLTSNEYLGGELVTQSTFTYQD
ncbi:hypothetical protein FG167_05785 [Lacinutrix sp. WUR7]|uniref:hypothetical protein n=1 Tax=Lacinutrix sp. WUR7 TaxID=2653681 RepID=UPI00193D1C1E|nr:hypothetical protein [Lacinutrix sp. WUR7]QRM88763.1 hypothetical protein FG167_05785 [Lacinutrix sp. WUR7]